MRREKRAAFGKVSLRGQGSAAAFSGDVGDEGGNGVGGDAPREPHCHTVCSPGTRTQSEVLPRLRWRLSVPAWASGRLGSAAVVHWNLASPRPRSHQLPWASELQLQLPAFYLESQPQWRFLLLRSHCCLNLKHPRKSAYGLRVGEQVPVMMPPEGGPEVRLGQVWMTGDPFGNQKAWPERDLWV